LLTCTLLTCTLLSCTLLSCTLLSCTLLACALLACALLTCCAFLRPLVFENPFHRSSIVGTVRGNPGLLRVGRFPTAATLWSGIT
jgi:hypothetical protein